MMNKSSIASKQIGLSFLILVISSSLYGVSVKEAQQLEMDGKLELALIEWKKLASRAADNAPYFYQVGRLYYEMGKPEEAKMYLVHALSLNPKDVKAGVKLGYVFFALGDYASAKNQFEHVLKEYPGNQEAKNGLVLVNGQEFEVSDQKSTAKPSEEEVKLMQYAQKVEKRDQYQQALAIWMKLDAEHPDNAYYLYHIGRIYYAMNKEKIAEGYLLRSLQINSKNADAKVILGYVYYDLGMNAKARALFKEALAIDPTYEGAKKGLQLIRTREVNAKNR